MLQPSAGATQAYSGERGPLEWRPPNPYQSEAQNFLNRAVAKLSIKRALHWAHPDFFHEYASYRWLSPYSCQLPGRYYKLDATQQAEIAEQGPDEDRSPDEIKESQRDQQAEACARKDRLKYLDVFRRKTRDKVEDRSIDPVDGQLGILVVQATSIIYNERNRTTWRRTYMENVSPYIVRLAYWPTSKIAHSTDDWETKDWIYTGLRWFLSSIGLLIVVCLEPLRVWHT